MKIILAWEVGRNFGHVTKLVELAKAISKNNKKAEFYFILQTPNVIFPFVSGLKYKLLQAPYHPPRPLPDAKKRGPSRLYSDDLRPCGYYDSEVLAGLIQSWDTLFEIIKPDLLIAQAAPTALLAARGHNFKKVVFGGTYDVPALSTPMPPTRYWEKNDPKMLKAREEEAVGIINEALKKVKKKPLKNLAESLDTDAQYLTMFEELDHYPGRAEIEGREIKYHGPFFTDNSGEDVEWKKTAKKRIFAYIRPDGGGFKACIDALVKLPKDVDCIVSAPGAPAGLKKQLAKTPIRLFTEPVKLSSLLKECDLGIGHGSVGISCAYAMYGVPQLLLPGHIEQFMFARALGRNKLGRGLAGRYGPKKVAEVIQLLLTDQQYTQASKAFAEKYKSFKPQNLAKEIAGEILKVAKSR